MKNVNFYLEIFQLSENQIIIINRHQYTQQDKVAMVHYNILWDV